jgi:cation diffusion facilitator family transporter
MTNNTLSKEKQVQRIIVIEGIANAIVLAAKTVVGITTGSLAVIGDALHSLTDVANNIVAWTVVKHAAKPADKEHPYGHHKFETLAVLGLAVILVVLGLELALHAIQKEATTVASSSWELAVMLGVLAVNIILATWQRAWAKKLDSDILLADASHTFADVLTTVAVIAGWQLSAMGYVWLDQIAALAVSGMIFYLAYELFKKAAPVLVDEYAVDPDLIIQTVNKLPEVKGCCRVRSRWIGNQATVDMVIHLPYDLTTKDSHEICDQVEAVIEQEFAVSDISIHVEPFHE